MKTLVLDFETFFASDFTLSKMTTEAYVRDPRFEAHCLGWYDPATGTKGYIEQPDIPKFIASVDWSQYAVLAHHAHFDGLILSHWYGMKPAFWFDTLSMARAIHGNHISVSLANLLRIYGIPEKTVPYDLFKGKRFAQLDEGTRRMLGNGAADDCEKEWQVFQKLAPGYPKDELRLIDMTVRMFTEPQLIGDAAHLERIQADEWTRKDELIQRLGISKADLMSNDKFAEILDSMGIEVEYKTSPTGNQVPAFAKTDSFMRELEADADPTIAALATARLEAKSTIDETRAGRLAAMARRGFMAVYLQYAGAHTLRWSGGDKVNWQNFVRLKKDAQGQITEGEIRTAIHAPPGYVIFEPDFSQIEARVLLWLAGQFDRLDDFRQGRDIYSETATEFYGFKVDKSMLAERGTGKQLVLSCGFGAGDRTIQLTAARGAYGPPVHMSLEDAGRAKMVWRRRNARVCAMWKECDWLLGQIVMNASRDWGPMKIHNKRLWLPSGLSINYEKLEWHGEEYRMLKRNGWTKMYGAKLVENAVQALARVIASQAMLRIAAWGIRPINTTHDSLMFLLKDDEHLQQWCDAILAEMIREPAWMPDIPLAAEGKPSRTYAK